MSETPYSPQPAFSRELTKGGLIALLILLLLIPIQLVKGLIQEREDRQQQAIAEVSARWAASGSTRSCP